MCDGRHTCEEGVGSLWEVMELGRFRNWEVGGRVRNWEVGGKLRS
jgi:hypothetical protein